ncbi:hypothetical protein QJ48_25850 [Paenibacillus sp. A3]|nr:hypothetical protein QJ48_25850 [Paenibacillus sp. A3]
MNLLHQLLLNMLIVITPVMLYHLFWIDRLQHVNVRTNQIIVTVICTVASLVSMMHPFELSPGYLFDFRLIPLALCFFYAGPLPALGVAAIIMAYYWKSERYGLHTLPISIGFNLILLWYCKRRIADAARLLNTATAAGLGFVLSLITAFVALFSLWLEHIPVTGYFFLFFALFSLIHSFTAGLVVYIIRQIKRNIELRKQLQHNDKMNMLSELAASFAHEIRNPMTVARGFVQMMRQNDLAEDKRQIYSQMVLEEVDKAQAIINDYLSFAKPQLEEIELVDAKPLILQTVQTLQSYADLRGVSVETQLQDKLMISANPDKFAQCIMHLCKNGIEAMPGGGKLQIVGVLQNQTVCIDIIDQGIGMTQDEVGRLGTPFYSTRGKGTGLGMMVTYRAIQNIHGRIDVTSEVGKGTCFSILIPSLHSSTYH